MIILVKLEINLKVRVCKLQDIYHKLYLVTRLVYSMNNHFQHICVKNGSTEISKLISIMAIECLNIFVISAKSILQQDILFQSHCSANETSKCCLYHI